MRLPMPVMYKVASAAEFRARFPGGRTLNVGGTGMVDAVNFDLQWDADVKGDAHELGRHFAPASFDRVICTAMLQYCRRPHVVVDQVREILAPGGLVYVDTAWVQPSCSDGACRDLFRFSDDGLRALFEDGGFEVLEVRTSIPAVSALAFYIVKCEPTSSRYVNAACRYVAGFFLGLLARTRRGLDPMTAGGFCLIARRPAN